MISIFNRLPVTWNFGTIRDRPIENYAYLNQVHGEKVLIAEKPGFIGDADALITGNVGLPLIIRTADCVPILYACKTAVAAAHAGWRGTAADISVKTLLELCNFANVTPQQVFVAIGPAIGACCYDVGQEVLTALSQPLKHKLLGPEVDLKAINLELLERAGANVEVLNVCTSCDNNYWSFRKTKTDKRQISWICLER